MGPIVSESALVSECVTLSDESYIGPFCQVGAYGFQQTEIRSFTDHDNCGSVTSLGAGFTLQGWSFIGCGTQIEEGFRGDSHISIGENCRIGPQVVVEYGARVYNNVTVGARSQIGGFLCNDAVIGSDCVIQGKLIHRRTDAAPEAAPIVGDGVLIGTGAIIVGGVLIGDGCVIAAGAVVLESTEPGYMYAGTPATKRKRAQWR